MPWCETCQRDQNPSSLEPDGTCSTCGSFIASVDDEPEDEGRSRAPWHFYLLMVVLVIYLGYRLFQGIVIVIGWL